MRELITRRGTIRFPAFIPVTTFGTKYPLDDLVRPYLPRLAQAVMVSHYYARQQTEEISLPMLVDSGGFASLFERATVVEDGALGTIRLRGDEATDTISPGEVLDFQEARADVAFTLDFPVPPGFPEEEARRRQRLTISNALWALKNRRRRDLPLYASVQGWDIASYSESISALADAGFDGLAIGGMVPRYREEQLILSVVESARTAVPHLPIHVFGLGRPQLIQRLFEAGIDSVDSSAYVKLAADGRLWSNPDAKLERPSPMQRLHLALCNLATATGASLPLGFASSAFATASLTSLGHAPK